MKKWASMLVVLGLVGCGAAPVPVVDEGSPAGQAIPQCVRDADCDDRIFCNGIESCIGQICFAGAFPCPGLICDEGSDTCRAAPPVVQPTAGPLVPGDYLGVTSCRIDVTANGVAANPRTLIAPQVVVVEPGGASIQDMHEGDTETSFDTGVIAETTREVTSVEVFSNAIVIEGDVAFRYACLDSCQYARDGECDERTFCNTGTDCRDCGQFTLFGSRETTIIRSGSSAVEFASDSFGTDRNGLVFFSIQCSGTLERLGS